MTERRRRPVVLVTGLVLGIGALVTSFPFFWMISSSFKSPSEAMSYPPSLLPQNPTVAAYVRLFTELDFGTYLRNTVVVVLFGVVGLFFMAMAGYGFAKFRFRGRGPLFLVVLMTLMIPVQVTMIPTYLILNRIGLTNTLLGVAAPTLVSAFGIFLFRQFMATIPDELLEAARLDGASEARIFTRIVLPLSKPILAVQGVLTFISGWNSFLWPLIIVNDIEGLGNVSLGLQTFFGERGAAWNLILAASVISIAPTMLVVIALQKHLVKGIATVGLAGR